MELQKGLTLEFFNPLKERYPEAMKTFCDWIDDYKKEVYWYDMFGDGLKLDNFEKRITGMKVAPKFHELPYAIQLGIWFEFELQQLKIKYPKWDNVVFDTQITDKILEHRISKWLQFNSDPHIQKF